MMTTNTRKLFFFLALLLLVGLFILLPQIAHAQNLHADLTFPGSDGSRWVFNVWKVMLGIANVFVVIVLLFFGFC